MDWLPELFQKVIACLLIVISINTVAVRGAWAPCAAREEVAGQVVCVCNATYCDALDAAFRPPEGRFALYTSSKGGLRLANVTGPLASSAAATAADGLQFAIDPSSTHQTIIGWGTSFTDSAGLNTLSLSESTQDNLLKSYFSTEGLALGIGRVPIGGTDFSTHAYTYDDVPGDTDLSEFKLAPEDHTYKIPLVKRAAAMRSKALRLLGAAWSAPPWMKTNNDYTGFGFLKEEHYQLWADYHVKFFEAYAEEGLRFWAVSTGNEPSNGIIPFAKFNSMGWTPKSQGRWVAENLGPALAAAAASNDTLILALDDQRFSLPWWIDVMLENEKAQKYVAGVAVHWYWDQFITPSVLTATHNHHPDKFILYTEACRGERPWDRPKVNLGSWRRGADYMTNIIQDMNHWVGGWVDWNLALDRSGGPNWVANNVDAAIIVDADKDEFYKQPMFYALAHFAKFVPEGSVHVALQPQSQGGVDATAFTTPDGQAVVILHNRKKLKKQVTVKHPEKGSVSVTIPANSFNTLLF